MLHLNIKVMGGLIEYLYLILSYRAVDYGFRPSVVFDKCRIILDIRAHDCEKEKNTNTKIPPNRDHSPKKKLKENPLEKKESLSDGDVSRIIILKICKKL